MLTQTKQQQPTIQWQVIKCISILQTIKVLPVDESKAGIGVGSAVFLVIVMILVVVLVKKLKYKNKRKKAAARAEVDANPVYGLYECDADPQVDKPINNYTNRKEYNNINYTIKRKNTEIK